MVKTMKIIQVTKRIGEWLGPIDWSYNFESHDWDHGGSINPVCVQESINFLWKLDSTIAPMLASNYSGWPKIWHKVMKVGMYDGWPYWRPVPSISVIGTLGIEIFSMFSLTGIRRNK